MARRDHESFGEAAVGSRARRWRRWLLPRLALAGLVVAGLALLPDRAGSSESERRLEAMTSARDQAAVRHAALRADNLRRLREVRALRDDRRAIEEVARRELGMVYPGERVIDVTLPDPSGGGSRE